MIRNLAIRIVIFLCHRFNIALVAEARVANGTEAVARGQRWQAFYDEEDGLRDMFASLRQDYFAKVGEVKPGDTDTLLVLGLADKVAREIERKVQSVIETGKLRDRDRTHTNNIAAIGR